MLHVLEGRGIEPFVNDADTERIKDLHLLDRLVVGQSRGKVLRVHDRLVRKLYIIGIEGVSIMKCHIGAELEEDDGIVLGRRQYFIGILNLFVFCNRRAEAEKFSVP